MRSLSYRPSPEGDVPKERSPQAHPQVEPSVTNPPNHAHSILDLVGHTPMVELARLRRGVSSRVRIYAKLEGFNPGGSVKDRPAVWMVRKGLESGALREGKTILDSTSGNTGIESRMVL